MIAVASIIQQEWSGIRFDINTWWCLNNKNLQIDNTWKKLYNILIDCVSANVIYKTTYKPISYQMENNLTLLNPLIKQSVLVINL